MRRGGEALYRHVTAAKRGALSSERKYPTEDLCVSQKQMRLDGAILAPEWMNVQFYTLSCMLARYSTYNRHEIS